ncbi:expressed protein [Phakopsora pachyrhizi]|uniref:Expressed protein n=1 Tax=Phakopsora pachyrhizi TaxID=170000 RepID=A0AAV0AD93_PHAPC|nr:expressed protein [Phakopsora pachyrhizi]
MDPLDKVQILHLLQNHLLKYPLLFSLLLLPLPLMISTPSKTPSSSPPRFECYYATPPTSSANPSNSHWWRPWPCTCESFILFYFFMLLLLH